MSAPRRLRLTGTALVAVASVTLVFAASDIQAAIRHDGVIEQFPGRFR